MKKNILLFILTVVLVISPKLHAQIATQDSVALVAFYNATDGTNWTNNTNWLNGPVSTWAGITVVNGRVYTFRFYSNNIKGNIPPEIGQLTQILSIRPPPYRLDYHRPARQI